MGIVWLAIGALAIVMILGMWEQSRKDKQDPEAG